MQCCEFSCLWCFVSEECAKTCFDNGLLAVCVGVDVWFVASLVRRGQERDEAAVSEAWRAAGAEARPQAGQFDPRMLEAAMRRRLVWMAASRGLALIDDRAVCRVTGKEGEWVLEIVATRNNVLMYGWTAREVRWHPITPQDATKQVCECVIGGLARRGRFVGIAECDEEQTASILACWEKRFNLTTLSRFVAKVLMEDGSLTLVPLSFVFCPNQAPSQVAAAFSRGFIYLNQVRAKAAKNKRVVVEQNLTTTHENHASSSEDADGLLDPSGGATVSPPPVAGFSSVALQETVPEDIGDDTVWRMICADDVVSSTWSRMHRETMFRLVIGHYAPLKEIRVHSFQPLFRIERPPREDLEAADSEAETQKSRKRARPVQLESPRRLEESQSDTNTVPGSQLRNQWICRWSRELIWGSDSERFDVAAGSARMLLEALPLLDACPPLQIVWEVVEDPKLRARWDTGAWVDVDMAALSLWEKLRLAPAVPPKKVSYVVFCSDCQDRAAANFFADVASMWTALSLGVLAPEVPESPVIEVLGEGPGGTGDGFVREVRKFLLSQGEEMENTNALPLVVFLVWPQSGGASRELSVVLDAFDEGCFERQVLLQVVPEERVLRPPVGSLVELREFVLELFSTVRVFKMVSSEPAFVRTHTLLAARERSSVHVAFAVSQTGTLSLAAHDASGEIWCSAQVQLNGLDAGHAVIEFLRGMLPETLDWDVALLDCSGFANRVSFEGIDLPKSVALAHVRPHSLALPSDGYERAIGKASDQDVAWVKCGERAFCVAGAPDFVVEDLAIMMLPARGCPHVDFVLAVS